MELPPTVWLAGEPGYDQWSWVRGVMAAHKAGSVHQVLVVERGLPCPNLELGGRVEVVEMDAATRRQNPGMLGTLQVGLRALGERHPGPLYLALARRPGASSETYRVLWEELERSGAGGAKPRAGGKHGHPVLLGAAARRHALLLDPREAQVRDLTLEATSVEVEDRGVVAGP